MTVAWAHDTSPRFGVFTLRTECPRCGAHLPANGPAPEVECTACTARVRVPPELLGGLVQRFEDAWPDVEAAAAHTIGDLTWRWTAAPAAGPVCAACGAVVPPGPDDAEALVCACGARVESGPPGRLRGGCPSAARVFGADPDEPPPPLAAAPVAMVCPQCGAGLSITAADRRTTPCAHCGVPVHVPDAAWRALHPPRTVRPWTVRFDGESRPARAARLAAEEAVRKRAAAEAEKERRRRAAEERAERDAREAAARAARAEEEARRRAAEARRFRLRMIPVVGLAWVAGLGGAVAVLGAGAWYTFGPLRVLLPLAPRAFWEQAPRPAVVLGFGAAYVAWLLVHAATALRSRQRVGGLVALSLAYAGLAHIPVVGTPGGLLFAALYLGGGEPTLAGTNGRVPWSMRLPGAALLASFAVAAPALLAAILGIPVLGPDGILERFFD